MAKPIVIAKSAGPNWTIHYIDDDTGEAQTVAVLGATTIDEALHEAKSALDEKKPGLYTITEIALDDNAAMLI